MPTPFITRRRVEFRDADAAGIAHFSVYFNYMEEAEHEFLRSLGTSVIFDGPDGQISWPRVAVACEYRGALHFEDEFEIQVRIERLGEKSVTYNFEFAMGSKELARGKITAVCCRLEAGQPPKSIPIPAEIAAKLRSFVST
jgi:4-hydroxybenzoyl-CoA thioesterase/acyl-CoA thioester hydrolase